jgi:hypothetical protein
MVEKYQGCIYNDRYAEFPHLQLQPATRASYVATIGDYKRLAEELLK